MCNPGDASLAAVLQQQRQQLSAPVLAGIVLCAALLTALLGLMFHLRYRRELQQVLAAALQPLACIPVLACSALTSCQSFA